jgi:hypothetical protein
MTTIKHTYLNLENLLPVIYHGVPHCVTHHLKTRGKNVGYFQKFSFLTYRLDINVISILRTVLGCIGEKGTQAWCLVWRIEIFSLTLRGVGDCSQTLNSVLASPLPAPLYLLVT